MKRPLVLGGAASSIGLFLIVISGLLDRWSRDWVSAAMLTIGAALALAAAFYWLNRTLDQHVRAVEQRVESTEAAVDQVQDDLQQQRQDLDAILRERLDPENHPVAKTIRRARETATAATVVEALRAAREEGSLGPSPPMVALRGAPTFWVRVDEEDGVLVLQLGRERQALNAAPIVVDDGQIADALTDLGQRVQSIAGQMTPEPEYIFPDVLDLLELGRTHEKRKGLFARVGAWGAVGRYVVSLDERRPVQRNVAINNPSNPLASAPRGLTEQERRDYSTVQRIVLEYVKMFSRREVVTEH